MAADGLAEHFQVLEELGRKSIRPIVPPMTSTYNPVQVEVLVLFTKE